MPKEIMAATIILPRAGSAPDEVTQKVHEAITAARGCHEA